jgi:ABC-type sugar transport system substrate-binding protein
MKVIKMTSVKNFIVVSLFISLFLCISGFGQAKTKTFFVAFCQDNLNNPWRAYQAACVERELKKHPNIKYIVTDGQGRSDIQISNIEDVVTKGIDLLITSPIQEAALTPVVREVYKSGIPVVLVDRGVIGSDYTCWVMNDCYNISAALADDVAAMLTKKYGSPTGTVVEIEGVPGSTSGIDRKQGFDDRIRKKYPNIKVLASQPGNYRRDKAMTIMEDYLQTFPKIDVAYVQSDEMAMGAIAAIEHANRRKEIYITSINGVMEAIEAITKDRMDVSAFCSNCGTLGAKAALDILNHKKAPKQIMTEFYLINKTNAAKLYDKNRYSPE